MLNSRRTDSSPSLGFGSSISFPRAARKPRSGHGRAWAVRPPGPPPGGPSPRLDHRGSGTSFFLSASSQVSGSSFFPGFTLESLATLNYAVQFLPSAFSVVCSPTPSLAKSCSARGHARHPLYLEVFPASLEAGLPFLGGLPLIRVTVCIPLPFGDHFSVFLGPDRLCFP